MWVEVPEWNLTLVFIEDKFWYFCAEDGVAVWDLVPGRLFLQEYAQYTVQNTYRTAIEVGLLSVHCRSQIWKSFGQLEHVGQCQFTSFFQVSGFQIILLKYFLTLSLLFLNLCRSQRWNPFVNQLHPASGILHFGNCSWERVEIFADKSWHFEVYGFFNSFFTNMDILLSCQIKDNSKIVDIDVFFRIGLTNDPKSYPYLFEPFHSVW